MPDLLVTLLFVPLMIVGFGFIVAVHEFGHFIAARWAGIRVHAFAIGFGQALCSYRKGFGWRRGSSEPRYMELRERHERAGTLTELERVSPTEYRLNWIPFGGYVKMLGQDDADLSHRSDEPDSYQNASIPKRMVVISAGVILNVALAALLFVAVYMAGIEEPSNVVASAPDSPAARAGVNAGDTVLMVNGERTPAFRDAMVAIALAPGGRPVELLVRPVDLSEPRELRVEPLPSSESALGVPTIGIAPATSATIWPKPLRSSERAVLEQVLDRAGVGHVPPGSTLVAVNGVELIERGARAKAGGDQPGVSATNHEAADDGAHRYRLFDDARRLIERADGPTARLAFVTPTGERVEAVVTLRPELQTGRVSLPTVNTSGEATALVEHVLGLSPLVRVSSDPTLAPRQGLEPGDVFARVGTRAWPSMSEAMTEIRSRAGTTIELVVLRPRAGAGDGVPAPEATGERKFQRVVIDAEVTAEGRVGFIPEAVRSLPILSATPDLRDADDTALDTPAERLGIDNIVPGTWVRSVAGEPVRSFGELRNALRRATASQREAGEGVSVKLNVSFLPAAGEGEWALSQMSDLPRSTVTLEVTAEEVAALHELGVEAPGLGMAFEPIQTLLQADGPLGAMGMGVGATKRIIAQTYLTLRRLFEGSVPVNQLQGPVGITYTGSRIAERGFIYVLYFMALISANLAVINFLPIPITDGGQFLLLCYEAAFRKPMPIVAQNLLTLAGLLAIGAVFLYVTFHDILRIF